MKDHLWKKGQSGNPAGTKKGVHHEGRPPDWLRVKCQNIVDKEELLEVLTKIATGADMEQVVTENGETVSVPAAIKERLKAIEILLKHGWPSLEKQQTAEQSVQNVTGAITLLKLMEEAVINANTRTGAGGDSVRLADRAPALQIESAPAQRV